MSQIAKTAIEAWKEANDEARIAENRLSRAWDEFDLRRNQAVDPALIKEVSDLRARANALLSVALESLKPTARNTR
jgi:ferric-dicitrate binding protein FerR (iron transport regulator)